MFVLPNLKKPYNAFEPYIDEATMRVHHQGHHKKYVENLNRGLVESGIDTERIEELFEKASELTALVRNNAGGHYNHTIFWTLLNDTMSTPSPDLMEKIVSTFGSLDDFKAEFTKSALELFGSGWTWLIVDGEGNLVITNTPLQDNPLMNDVEKRGYPIIGLDLWEHAYYLKHQNHRVNYAHDFWAVLDWNEVSRRYRERPEMTDFITSLDMQS